MLHLLWRQTRLASSREERLGKTHTNTHLALGYTTHLLILTQQRNQPESSDAVASGAANRLNQVARARTGAFLSRVAQGYEESSYSFRPGARYSIRRKLHSFPFLILFSLSHQ